MTVWDAARAHLRRRPLVTDTALAAVVTTLALVGATFGPKAQAGAASLPGEYVAILAAGAGLPFRRQFPVPVLVGVNVCALTALALTKTPNGAYLAVFVALYTVATTCARTTTLVAGVASAVAPGLLRLMLGGDPTLTDFVYGVAAWCGLAATVGLAVSSQRAVVAAAMERAHQAEATREEETHRKVAEERLRIARELHDVVAHHISAINVQAAVAERALTSQPEVAQGALRAVRTASQTVLRELPGILGLLRATPAEQHQPAPTVADIPALVDASRSSGLEVRWSVIGAPAELTLAADLAAYRVVQECLTNAARHGQGAVSGRVQFTQTVCDIEICNPIRGAHPDGQADPPTGSTTGLSKDPTTDPAVGHPERGASARLGLTGIRERVAAAGGRVEAGPDGHGQWRVHVQLPLTAPAGGPV